MSSLRHAVQRADNFTGAGNFPDLTPAHQVERPTGNRFNTSGNRSNLGVAVKGLVSGVSFCIELDPLLKETKITQVQIFTSDTRRGFASFKGDGGLT